MFIVKGVNVFPLGVQAPLSSLRPRLTGEFRIVLDRPPPIDYAPRVVAEVARDVPEAGFAELAAENTAAIARELNFSAAVELAIWATPSYAVRLATALDGRRHSRETLGRSCGRQGSSP